MVANLHETKFKTTKNNSVNQKKLLRGNLHVNFQCEGQLKFFDVVGSFFLAHWIFDWHWKKILVSDFSHKLSMCMTLDTLNEQACQNLYHPGCWGYSTSTFWFFSNLRFFLKYWSGSILYIGRLCLASDKTLYVCFHVPRRWFRNEEMRSAAEGRLKEYNKPALSWVTSKEYVNHVYTKNTKLKFPVVWGVFW